MTTRIRRRQRTTTAFFLQVGLTFGAVLWTFGTVGDGQRGETIAQPHRSEQTPVESTDAVLKAPLTVVRGDSNADRIQYEILSSQAKSLLASGRLEPALDAYRETLRLSRARGNRAGEASAELAIARVERRLGKLQEALRAGERAITLAEEIHGSQAPSWSQGTYSFAVDLLMELHQREGQKNFAATAFEVAERARARRLVVDLLHDPTSRPLSLQEVQALLDNETLLLSFWLADERSFLWIVGHDSFESRVLPSRSTIEDAAIRAYSALSQSRQRIPRVSSELALMSLSKLILAPTADILGEKRLVIVSDGALQNIPFAALLDPSRLSLSLIESHEIVMLPSASILRSLRDAAESRPEPPRLLAVIADPVFGPDDPRLSKGKPLSEAELPESTRAGTVSAVSDLPRLPDSRLEAEEILRFVPSSSPTLKAMGFDATLELAKSGALAQYRYVHFATHGVIDTKHLGWSGIVLSTMDRDGNRLDGLLSSSEIRNLQLSADLVVLSACQTGRGRDLGRQGRETLLTSFQAAGASRVVASLWSIDDFATSELMKHFYRGILKEGREPSDALRQAQISMLRDPRWSAPFYWAGFIIEGDWKPR